MREGGGGGGNAGAESDALLPAARQAAGNLSLLAFKAGEPQDPAPLIVAFFFGNSVDAGEELEVLGEWRDLSHNENFCDM